MNSDKVYTFSKLIGYVSFVLFFIAAKPDVHAQSGFAKAIPIDANVSTFDIIFHNDQLILRGSIEIDSLRLIGLLIAGIDTNGILLWKSVLLDTAFSFDWYRFTSSRFLIADDRLVIPVRNDQPGEIVVYFTDLVGHELFHRNYSSEGLFLYPFDINQIGDEYFVTGHISFSGGDRGIFVLKIKSNGEMVWIKYYGQVNLYESSIDADVNPDNTLTLYAERHNRDFALSEAMEGWKQPWVFTIDTSGAIVDEWLGEENDPRTLGGEYFFRMENGDWIMQGTHYINVPAQFGEEVKASPTITRLDSNFNQKWKRYLTNYEERWDRIFDMEYDHLQGQIVLTGDKSVLIGNKYEDVNWTIKLDTTGQIIWDVTDSIYYSRQNFHFTAGLELAPSGSIYVGGYVEVNELEPERQAFVIKYTSDGCSDTLCTTTSINEQIKQVDEPIVMYPNPASDVLHVLVREATGPCQMQLSDMHGRIAFVSKISTGSQDISLDLTPGIYISTFTNSTGIFYSRKLIVY